MKRGFTETDPISNQPENHSGLRRNLAPTAIALLAIGLDVFEAFASNANTPAIVGRGVQNIAHGVAQEFLRIGTAGIIDPGYTAARESLALPITNMQGSLLLSVAVLGTTLAVNHVLNKRAEKRAEA